MEKKSPNTRSAKITKRALLAWNACACSCLGLHFLPTSLHDASEKDSGIISKASRRRLEGISKARRSMGGSCLPQGAGPLFLFHVSSLMFSCFMPDVFIFHI